MALRHFTARTSLQPQGIRARCNVQVRGQLLGMCCPCIFLINDPTFPPHSVFTFVKLDPLVTLVALVLLQ